MGHGSLREMRTPRPGTTCQVPIVAQRRRGRTRSEKQTVGGRLKLNLVMLPGFQSRRGVGRKRLQEGSSFLGHRHVPRFGQGVFPFCTRVGNAGRGNLPVPREFVGGQWPTGAVAWAMAVGFSGHGFAEMPGAGSGTTRGFDIGGFLRPPTFGLEDGVGNA